MEWGTPVWWGWFLLFSRSGGHKTKETYPTRLGSPTPCKQGLSYTFYGGNVVLFFSLFFHCRSFSPCIGGCLSPPLHNYHVVLPTKKCLLCYLSLPLDLCHSFSRLAALACRLLSLFLCPSLALFPNLWT